MRYKELNPDKRPSATKKVTREGEKNQAHTPEQKERVSVMGLEQE